MLCLGIGLGFDFGLSLGLKKRGKGVVEKKYINCLMIDLFLFCMGNCFCKFHFTLNL